MKRIICLFSLLLLLLAPRVQAQSLLVYHVVGKVTYNTNGGSKPLVLNTTITANTSINVPYGGKVELLNEKNRQRIIIKKSGQGTVKQLSASDGNSVSELSEKYVVYVKKQLTNKGLTSQKRYTDFATVTRELDSVKTEPAKPQNSLAARFNQFKKNTIQKFQSFREECNKKYTDFVRKAWETVHADTPVQRPEEPIVKPIEYQKPEVPKEDDKEIDNRDEQDALIKGKEMLANVTVPIVPAISIKQPQPIEIIKQTPVKEEEKEYSTMPFVFFGNELSVRLDETKRINIGDINPNRIADVLMHLSGEEYDNLLYDCLVLREKYKLCDWAYLLMLKEIADQFCGAETNEAVILLGYLYYQSGYKIRFASDTEKKLYLLIASDYMIYGKPSFMIDGERFYPMEETGKELNICKAKFPKESTLSLQIAQSMQFDKGEADERTITSKRYPDVTLKVAVNRSLIDFYNEYPSSFVNDDIYSRWVIYAETPMDDDVKNQIYPVLKEKLKGMSDYDAVNRLLNLVQTGLEYGYDDEIWGGDRAFFSEESLHYPFCDCEDRSILLTRMVRDLLGLECVLIYYPGHLACAIHFNEKADGDYYTFNGKEYTVCDPTYINAPIGMQMPNMATDKAVLIPLK